MPEWVASWQAQVGMAHAVGGIVRAHCCTTAYHGFKWLTKNVNGVSARYKNVHGFVQQSVAINITVNLKDSVW